MGRLLGIATLAIQADRLAMALDAARRWNAHFVLKGYHTIVASPDGQTFVSTTGNAGLAKGGTGDVLTGILAALIAQFGSDDGARVLRPRRLSSRPGRGVRQRAERICPASSPAKSRMPCPMPG